MRALRILVSAVPGARFLNDWICGLRPGLVLLSTFLRDPVRASRPRFQYGTPHRDLLRLGRRVDKTGRPAGPWLDFAVLDLVQAEARSPCVPAMECMARSGFCHDLVLMEELLGSQLESRHA